VDPWGVPPNAIVTLFCFAPAVIAVTFSATVHDLDCGRPGLERLIAEDPALPVMLP